MHAATTTNAPKTRRRKGDGSVTWIARRGQYRVRVPQRDRPGSPIERWSPGPETPAQERAAHALRNSLIADRDIGGPVLDRTLTVGQWLDEWMGLQAGKRPETVRAYRARIDLYLIPALGRYRLADLDGPHIQRAYDRLRQRPGQRRERLSESTILAAHKVLTAALNDARKANPPRIATNPAERVTVRDASPEIEPPTIDQVATLIDSLDPADPMRAYYLVAYWSGARQGEIAGLRHSDVDPDARTLTYRRQADHATGRGRRLKAGGGRTVVIPQDVVDAIAALPRHASSPLVFHQADGRALSQSIIHGHFQRACAALDLTPPTGSDLDHFRPHDLRHAFATLMRQAGAADVFLMGALGHASTKQLDRYSHVRPTRGGQAYYLVLGSLGAADARDWYGIR